MYITTPAIGTKSSKRVEGVQVPIQTPTVSSAISDAASGVYGYFLGKAPDLSNQRDHILTASFDDIAFDPKRSQETISEDQISRTKKLTRHLLFSSNYQTPCLVIGYHNGFQIWDMSRAHESNHVIHEVISKRFDHSVSAIKVIQTMNPVSTLPEERPYLAYGKQTIGGVQHGVLQLYSIPKGTMRQISLEKPGRDGDQVVQNIQSNNSWVAIGTSKYLIYLMDISSLEVKHVIRAWYDPDPSHMITFALGPLWIAFQSNISSSTKVDSTVKRELRKSDSSSSRERDHFSNKPASGMTKSQPTTAQVLIDHGYQGLSGLVYHGVKLVNSAINTYNSSTGTTGTTSQGGTGSSREGSGFNSPGHASNSNNVGHHHGNINNSNMNNNNNLSSIEPNFPSGTLEVRDLDHGDSEPPPIAIFPTGSTIIQMAFDKPGLLLATAPDGGQIVDIWNIAHIVSHPNLPPKPMYQLNRGATLTSIGDISFNDSSSLISFNTHPSGSNHVFPINLAGKVLNYDPSMGGSGIPQARYSSMVSHNSSSAVGSGVGGMNNFNSGLHDENSSTLHLSEPYMMTSKPPRISTIHSPAGKGSAFSSTSRLTSYPLTYYHSDEERTSHANDSIIYTFYHDGTLIRNDVHVKSQIPIQAEAVSSLRWDLGRLANGWPENPSFQPIDESSHMPFSGSHAGAVGASNSSNEENASKFISQIEVTTHDPSDPNTQLLTQFQVFVYTQLPLVKERPQHAWRDHSAYSETPKLAVHTPGLPGGSTRGIRDSSGGSVMMLMNNSGSSNNSPVNSMMNVMQPSPVMQPVIASMLPVKPMVAQVQQHQPEKVQPILEIQQKQPKQQAPPIPAPIEAQIQAVSPPSSQIQQNQQSPVAKQQIPPSVALPAQLGESLNFSFPPLPSQAPRSAHSSSSSSSSAVQINAVPVIPASSSSAVGSSKQGGAVGIPIVVSPSPMSYAAAVGSARDSSHIDASSSSSSSHQSISPKKVSASPTEASSSASNASKRKNRRNSRLGAQQSQLQEQRNKVEEEPNEESNQQGGGHLALTTDDDYNA